MGDFNSNLIQKNIPENHLFHHFQDSGLTSLLDFYDIKEPTWSAQESSSQIDDIWVNYKILLHMTEPKLLDSTDSTKSDHKIIMTCWHIDSPIYDTRRKRKKKKTFLYDKMEEENWENFSKEIKTNISKQSY
ncbi:hypothetical protein F8M41_011782 [Gigaspora margarita]|uniref:Endonuclease/exonuclease/phosphatase domain-containing protein n=1 Tax=Gigaspora margarita TaxID=4874 RepID=A0A8H3X1Y5_GIGMA|nr:hypothetical protein F8M41_011782 [Gigaspora margarita]